MISSILQRVLDCTLYASYTCLFARGLLKHQLSSSLCGKMEDEMDWESKDTVSSLTS